MVWELRSKETHRRRSHRIVLYPRGDLQTSDNGLLRYRKCRLRTEQSNPDSRVTWCTDLLIAKSLDWHTCCRPCRYLTKRNDVRLIHDAGDVTIVIAYQKHKQSSLRYRYGILDPAHIVPFPLRKCHLDRRRLEHHLWDLRSRCSRCMICLLSTGRTRKLPKELIRGRVNGLFCLAREIVWAGGPTAE
jgi:hypothetical protein